MLRARALVVALAFVASWETAATAQPSAVKTHMDAGDAAAKAKDWEKAAAEYRAAFEAGHGASALEGLANALYEAKKAPEAYDAYDTLLASYADQLKKKFLAETRHKELANQTGALVVRVADSPAQVEVDGHVVGTSPIPPHRVAVGPHKVRVTKAGFLPYEQTVNVGAAASVTVDAALGREARAGHLVVREKTGKSMRVVVDGLDVGATPWEGDLPAGPHEILLRSSAGASTPQRVEVKGGGSETLDLEASASMGHLEVKTNEPTAILFLDGKALAEGRFAGDVAPGEHKLVVTKEGYERFERSIVVTPSGSDSVDVVLKKAGEQRGIAAVENPDRGIYGGLGLMGVALPAGTGNDVENRCNELGAESCAKSLPIGGGLFGYFGYNFDPVGFEVLLGGLYDQTSPTARFSGKPGQAGYNPLATGPARTEDFTFVRGGGTLAVRARLTANADLLRVSLAGGFGVSYKYVALAERKATSTDGKLSDTWAPSGSSYVSPAVTLDFSIQWRLARATALGLGLAMWLESSSFTDVRAPGDLNRAMNGTDATGKPLVPQPIVTPPYQLTSGAQMFVGPYVGVQFGP